MKKVIPVRLFVDDLCDTVFIGDPQPMRDLEMAAVAMIKAAHKHHFLSIPNPGNRNHFLDAVDVLEPRLRCAYNHSWYLKIYEYCMKYLAALYKEWDYVDMVVRNEIIRFDYRGDYRVYVYMETFGSNRVGDRPCDNVEEKPVAVDYEDPFFVADMVPVEANEDIISVTAVDLEKPFSEFKDNIRSERNGNALREFGGQARSKLLESQTLAAERYPGLPSEQRRAVVHIAKEPTPGLGEQAKRSSNRSVQTDR